MNLKKLLPVVLLAALIIWGIYDVKSKNNINNAAAGKANTNIEVKTDEGAEPTTGLERGELAPNFQLTALDGKQVNLSDYRGKKVILNFWATWCPPCKAEIPDLENFYSSYKEKDTVIVGVDLTGSEKGVSSVKDFVKSYGITYPVLFDTKNSVAELYQVSAIPTSYIIDSRGIITQKVIGPMDFETMKGLIAGTN